MLDTRRDINVRYSFTRLDRVQSTVVAHVTVPPLSSSTINLPELEADPGMQNSFIVESSARPGELYAGMRSVGDSTPWVSEVLGLDKKQLHNAGLHPWSIADGTTSTLLLSNHTGSAQSFHVLIAAGTTIWQKKETLASLETRAIDVNSLVAGGEKDDSGQVLPQSIQAGQLDWFTESAGEGTGRLLQSRPVGFLARGFNCGNTAFVCGAHNTPGSLRLAVDSTGNVTVITSWCTGQLIDCVGGTPTSQTNSYTVDWSVDNGNIADTSGPVNQPTVTLQGVAPGTATATASINGGVCFNPQTTVTVKPVARVTPGPTAILAWHTTSPPNQQASTCVDIAAAGSPSGGTYSWTTSSGKLSLANTTSPTVHICSVADQWSGAAGDASVSVTYTVSGIASQPAVTTVTILKPTRVSQVTSTVNSTGHSCTTLAGSNSCSQSTYQDTGTYTYTSYVRTIFDNIVD